MAPWGLHYLAPWLDLLKNDCNTKVFIIDKVPYNNFGRILRHNTLSDILYSKNYNFQRFMLKTPYFQWQLNHQKLIEKQNFCDLVYLNDLINAWNQK